ncbi:hypothetical protein GCM10011584_24110 [Nocardioides phosphati]|uniref:Uncharacterized protein n=1 Tax=Nocardioides phosphati TaxID=1867775 RepID=A0ABQ2NC64_9ACTN|nr:hypothetical protein GCM10011584_24110 [Nocardioides phosphati]
MIPQRPRRPRSVSAIEFHLACWESTIRLAEAGADSYFDDCPCGNGSEGLAAREALEAIIRRGGRQGRRASASVRHLDDRWERATYPGTSRGDTSSWWHRRTWR